MQTQTTQDLVAVHWRIPAALEQAIDLAWVQQRAQGDRESKQSLVARALEVGLKKVAKSSKS